MFLEEIEKTAKTVKSIIKEKKVKVISQFDSDGITSASILSKMLVRENVNFELKIVKQLTTQTIGNLDINENDFLIIADCGSGQLPMLKDIIEKTQVLILDHHEPVQYSHFNLFHINPLLWDEEELSASMVCYLFAKSMNMKNIDLVDLAIVGAIGDIMDDKWEFKGFAKKILTEAETIGKISINKGLRLYGQNKPLHLALAYSFEPFIPNVSGSESQAIQFLSELQIPVKNQNGWVKLKDITIEEQQRLASAIIRERINSEDSAEDIFGEIYTILGKPDEIQDVREFATLINSCGRINNPDIALRLCLGDYTILEKSFEVLSSYRKLISESLSWVKENENSIITTEFANYILAKNRISDSIIGTITSLILNSNFFNSQKTLFGFADAEETITKVSARNPRNCQINLRDVMVKAVSQTGYEAGGHTDAAGAFIPKGKEEEFIKVVDKILGEEIGKKN